MKSKVDHIKSPRDHRNNYTILTSTAPHTFLFSAAADEPASNFRGHTVFRGLDWTGLDLQNADL